MNILAAEIAIKRQEGDTSDLVINVPSAFDPASYNIHFEVFKSGKGIFKKINHGATQDWSISGQDITARIKEIDTKGHPGRWRYELELWDTNSVNTILRGEFEIVPQMIKERRHG